MKVKPNEVAKIKLSDFRENAIGFALIDVNGESLHWNKIESDLIQTANRNGLKILNESSPKHDSIVDTFKTKMKGN